MLNFRPIPVKDLPQVLTGMRHYRRSRRKMWLNFAGDGEEEMTIQLGDGRTRGQEEVVLTMDDEDMQEEKVEKFM